MGLGLELQLGFGLTDLTTSPFNPYTVISLYVLNIRCTE